MRATIANITDEDVIRCFQNGLFSKHTYHDSGCNRPTTGVDIRDMMVSGIDPLGTAWKLPMRKKKSDSY
jgi:hypothetical protein